MRVFFLFLFHLLRRARRNPFAPEARSNQLKLIAVIKPHTDEARTVDTVICAASDQVTASLNGNHKYLPRLAFMAARRAAFGGRLTGETEKEGVRNRMLCTSEVKNKAAKQRKQSLEPSEKYRESRLD